MLEEIPVKRLTVGMHVSLKNVPWFKHPFLRSNFTIKSKAEIRDILALGRDTIFYDPERSKAKPLKKDTSIKVQESSIRFVDKSLEKNRKASELRARRKKFQQIEKNFLQSLDKSDNIMTGILNGRIQFCEEAKGMAKTMASQFLEEVQLCVNHINVSAADEGHKFHALNVMVLSLMLGKQLGLTETDMNRLALGALVHDVGMLEIPKKIRSKPRLSKLEAQKIREHPRLGVTLLSRMPDIDRAVMKIVYQHHEKCSGNGYPKQLDSDKIAFPAKIVC